MKAMILAAGRGQRMMPLTQAMPKPMLKVQNKPLIEHHVNNLKAAGITDIVINLAWQGDKIKAYFKDGSQFGVNIVYSQEVEGGLETAGGIIQALPLLGESFIVINGDVFTDYDVSSLMQLHLQPGEAHLVLIENPPHNLDGDFTLSHLSPDSQKYTFSGISRYQADFFNGLEPGIRPLGPLLREKLSKHLVSTELYIGNWDDIGTPARLTALNERLA
ncbi:mannose-1-phosphate guanylyltransferase [Pseudoalteromonas sp. 13-15]|jgi:MurNAc alpha-1-phosphate uridylyltransferase|uniref:N-acetylmuramate alpha-1-phosphate uridylyltransferase MurU n=1 Tax=Pseudoalteromonas TaxID=53246 RepID=UPI000231B86B|nr:MULTISPECIES: nucleotidyltransferase family protein [Pseudoalteromonas]MBL1384311.1 nucleotidyltransferase family protein [Colwellia sp.]ATG57140.1 nucleotidyltransferase family protein [Pseudoalteromonas marina]AUL73763.1 mannose-1-phosphate guanylyltransferase [Pseudoalteromonas sp. 13-15]WFO18808.1 nucleotidyltransferase family protein [Pseudoalteromonas sp. H100]SIN92736.1 MurNAc alpha-1-phosphate uridylyltransferase [Pseudoalteromonas marina]